MICTVLERGSEKDRQTEREKYRDRMKKECNIIYHCSVLQTPNDVYSPGQPLHLYKMVA